MLLSGLGLYSQGFTPRTITADDEDFVYGDVRIGDIIEFEQPYAPVGYSPTKKGIVFYINPERTEGWAVEQTNTISYQITNITWSGNNNALVDSLPIYSNALVGSLLSDMDGYNNTRLIRKQNSTPILTDENYVAGKIDFKNKWYLPAAGQLRKLYSVLPLLEARVPAADFTPLDRGFSNKTARYWSSTQSSSTYAWYVQGWNSASSGGNFVSGAKSTTGIAVRAVRTFKLKPSKLSYLWSPTGDTIPDITVSPSQTTEYCVTVTYGDLQCTAETCQTVVVNPTQVVNVDTLACDSFEWNGVTYTTDTIIVDTLQSVVTGCDSIVHMTVSVNQTMTGDDYATVCSDELPYTWQGVTFTGAGTQDIHLETVAGCDSLVHLHLTVNQTMTGDDYATVCSDELP